jgi:hypothetical protein
MVSQATAKLDETLEALRNRPLKETVFLYLDARYEKVRQDGQIQDASKLWRGCQARNMRTTPKTATIEPATAFHPNFSLKK